MVTGINYEEGSLWRQTLLAENCPYFPPGEARQSLQKMARHWETTLNQSLGFITEPSLRALAFVLISSGWGLSTLGHSSAPGHTLGAGHFVQVAQLSEMTSHKWFTLHRWFSLHSIISPARILDRALTIVWLLFKQAFFQDWWLKVTLSAFCAFRYSGIYIKLCRNALYCPWLQFCSMICFYADNAKLPALRTSRCNHNLWKLFAISSENAVHLICELSSLFISMTSSSWAKQVSICREDTQGQYVWSQPSVNNVD